MRQTCRITVGYSIIGEHGKPYLLEEQDAPESKNKHKLQCNNDKRNTIPTGEE